MKLWIQSDLHYEIDGVPSSIDSPEADVFVCAGDLMREPAEGLRWLSEHVPYPSIYVAGNHEYYRGIYTTWRGEGAAENAKHSNDHLLEDRTVTIGGVRFIGCTLWTDFAIFGADKISTAKQMSERGMNDYSQISYSYAKGVGGHHWKLARFTPNHTASIHAASRNYLEAALAESFSGKTVVVTHHAPSPRSVHEKYGNDWLNAAYVSDLTDLIDRFQPDMWIHGHVHTSFDYMVGKTRIVCNPKGYGRENLDFDPQLVVEI